VTISGRIQSNIITAMVLRAPVCTNTLPILNRGGHKKYQQIIQALHVFLIEDANSGIKPWPGMLEGPAMTILSKQPAV
jgi:hypothetical protein